MPLFDKFPVDRDEVADALSKHWGLVLGDVIKESQNHTFHASAPDGTRFAARATPDPDGTKHPRILKEVAFVRFLSEHGLAGACAPVPAARSSGALAAKTPGCTVCVYSWADGTPVDFAAYRWMTDKQLVRAWGAWLARLHAASREFARARPEAAEAVQRWDDIHDGIMRGASIHPDDAAAAGDPDKFGVLHGDCAFLQCIHHSSEREPPAPASLPICTAAALHHRLTRCHRCASSLFCRTRRQPVELPHRRGDGGGPAVDQRLRLGAGAPRLVGVGRRAGQPHGPHARGGRVAAHGRPGA